MPLLEQVASCNKPLQLDDLWESQPPARPRWTLVAPDKSYIHQHCKCNSHANYLCQKVLSMPWHQSRKSTAQSMCLLKLTLTRPWGGIQTDKFWCLLPNSETDSPSVICDCWCFWSLEYGTGIFEVGGSPELQTREALIVAFQLVSLFPASIYFETNLVALYSFLD